MSFKYPKFLALLLIFILVYLFFRNSQFLFFKNFLLALGYLGVFFAGIFYTYGFTAAPATVVLLILSVQTNLIIAGLTGGLGALVGDLLIFRFIRGGFQNEIEKLSREQVIIFLAKKTPRLIKKYFLPVLGSVVLASPLPDEIGVVLIAADKKISVRKFSLISYLLNTAGIFIILLLGK